jgi:hypothetical protein
MELLAGGGGGASTAGGGKLRPYNRYRWASYGWM